MIYYLKEFVISMIAAMGFSLVFQSPKKTVLISAINGGVGWVIYKIILNLTGSVYLGSLISAFVIAMLSETLARIFHYPASVFIFPGIINLCPGEAIYNTMNFFINNQTQAALISLYKAIAIAGAIAFGVLLSSSFSASLRTFRARSHRRTDFLRRQK